MQHLPINLLRNCKHEPPFIEGFTKKNFKNLLIEHLNSKSLKIYNADNTVTVIRCVKNYYVLPDYAKKCTAIRYALNIQSVIGCDDCVHCHLKCLEIFEAGNLNKKE